MALPRISLYWKLFGWFWFSMLAVMLALLLTLFAVLDPLDFLPERSRLQSALVEQAERVASAPVLPRRGLPGRGLFLLDEQGRNVHARRPVPPELRDFDRRHRNAPAPVAEVAGEHLLLGPQPLARDGRPLRLYLLRPLPHNPLLRLADVLLAHPLVVLVAIAVSGLACLLLAATLVRPLRQIRSGFEELGQGDLGRRIAGRVLRRGDEIGDLARDFNAMAASLQRSVEQQQRLLRHVSHELRTPLTRLGLALGIARQKSADVLLAEHGRMEQEITRMDRLLAQALQWSRLGAGLEQEPLADVDLVALLRDVVADAELEAADAGVTLTLELPQACRLQARPGLLRSAIENLLRNALRHAPAGTAVALALGCAGARVRLDVSDRGPGVPASELARLMEPFYRAERDRGDGQGSGMGLALARGIAELHGGTLALENLGPGFRASLILAAA